ncbi:unnamed protein product [Paramecium pentaurelia]|uniref:Uncharacterized protein n=1 Tax=Paramecium pentaurelia TaxID=43138 RepID=A0A8S1X2M5_9CILI|nr:unnamed protein product [Paramecium pentaurelia]
MQSRTNPIILILRYLNVQCKYFPFIKLQIYYSYFSHKECRLIKLKIRKNITIIPYFNLSICKQYFFFIPVITQFNQINPFKTINKQTIVKSKVILYQLQQFLNNIIVSPKLRCLACEE